MYLIMTISGSPFISVELDFEGKITAPDRQQYLEECATLLATEYQTEIERLGGNAEFYYSL